MGPTFNVATLAELGWCSWALSNTMTDHTTVTALAGKILLNMLVWTVGLIVTAQKGQRASRARWKSTILNSPLLSAVVAFAGVWNAIRALTGL